MLHLFDTDHLSLMERGGTESHAIFARLRLLSPDDYGISVVTYAEHMRGALAEIVRARNGAEEVQAFRLLRENIRFCNAFALWDYTEDAASHFAQLRQQKVRIGTQYLRIAAIALANNAILLTRNTKDFAKVPGLLFEDWTIE
jgi:tRNA(fMet)-specific endonuclease VapC